MTCQVIISDYVVERRMVYFLEAADFARQSEQSTQGDALLSIFQDHPFFEGCHTWVDLDIVHYHALIMNMLKISAEHADADVADKNHPTVIRLTFFLCSLINQLQSRTGCTIDLLRVNRIGETDVLYDYSARLDVVPMTPPRPTTTALRVVIDNEKKRKK